MTVVVRLPSISTDHCLFCAHAMETLDVLITHSHGSARVLGHEASQWKRPKFDPSPHQNPLNQSSPKFARVITSWTATAFQNFLPIGSGLSVRSPNT